MGNSYEVYNAVGTIFPIMVKGPKKICTTGKCLHKFFGGEIPKKDWPAEPTEEQVLQLIFNFHQARQYFQRAFSKEIWICMKYFAMEYPRIVGTVLQRKDAIRLTLTLLTKHFEINELPECETIAEVIEALELSGHKVEEIANMVDPNYQFDRKSQLFQENCDLKKEIQALKKQISEKDKKIKAHESSESSQKT